MLELLRKTEWSLFIDLVSPSFFEVLPGRVLRQEFGRLFSSTRDRAGFAALRAARGPGLTALGLTWTERSSKGSVSPLEDAGRRREGHAALRLYFHQLLHWDEVVVDQRAVAFRSSGGEVLWNPKPLWTRWEPRFRDGVRDVYRGFFAGDDARFRTGLAAMGMLAGEDVFRAVFGSDDQRAVAFSVKGFQHTFHEIFVRCRDAGAELPGGALPLGLTLGSLYQHLEALGGTFDVRAAFAAEVDR